MIIKNKTVSHSYDVEVFNTIVNYALEEIHKCNGKVMDIQYNTVVGESVHWTAFITYAVQDADKTTT